MSFVMREEEPEKAQGAHAIARLLAAETGLAVSADIAEDYAGVIDAMAQERTHVAWLDAPRHLVASDRFGARPLLAAERGGSIVTSGQIMVGADSRIDTLDGLVGKRFCRPDAMSTAGWLLPLLALRGFGVEEADFAEVVDSGSDERVVTAIYNGRCDAGAAQPDPRDGLEDLYPDIKQVVAVLALTMDAVNIAAVVVPSLSDDSADTIANGLLAVSMSEEGASALLAAFGAESLQPVDDEDYDALRAALDKAGIGIGQLTGLD